VPYKTKFLPEHVEKYIGNHGKILCKSLWERKVCKYLDLNENIINWCYECIKIPYISPIDNKKHIYFPDFVVKSKEKNGTERTMILEVKPEKQTKEPKNVKRKSYKNDFITFKINEAKWKAAEMFCKTNNWEFKLLTEKTLFGTNK